MSSNLISIITPAYNCASTLIETYNSIRNQTYTNWEWLVTEDCSSDNTLEILNEIVKGDSRVRVFVNNENFGAAVSRNNSLSKAKGEFVAFIDSDDLWYKDKLQKQLLFMLQSSMDFSFTAYELIDELGQLKGLSVDTMHTRPLNYRDMLKKKATLGCSTVMLRKCAFSDISMPLIRTGQDYGLWLKLLKTGSKAYPITEVLTQYRILPQSISRNKFKKAVRQWYIYRHIENLGILDAFICFFYYAWRAVFRK